MRKKTMPLKSKWNQYQNYKIFKDHKMWFIFKNIYFNWILRSKKLFCLQHEWENLLDLWWYIHREFHIQYWKTHEHNVTVTRKHLLGQTLVPDGGHFSWPVGLIEKHSRREEVCGQPSWNLYVCLSLPLNVSVWVSVLWTENARWFHRIWLAVSTKKLICEKYDLFYLFFHNM